MDLYEIFYLIGPWPKKEVITFWKYSDHILGTKSRKFLEIHPLVQAIGSVVITDANLSSIFLKPYTGIPLFLYFYSCNNI